MALVDTTIVVDPSNILVGTEAAQTVNVEVVSNEILVSGGGGIRGPKGEQGDQGIQGPQGIDGPNAIGGAPIVIGGLATDDILKYDGSAWSNRPQTVLTDGGNF